MPVFCASVSKDFSGRWPSSRKFEVSFSGRVVLPGEAVADVDAGECNNDGDGDGDGDAGAGVQLCDPSLSVPALEEEIEEETADDQ